MTAITRPAELTRQEFLNETDATKRIKLAEKMIHEIIIELTNPNSIDDLFWARLLTYTKREMDLELPAPMAVTSKNNKIHILINPNEFYDYSVNNIKAILKHEGYHILMNHMDIYADLMKDGKQAEIINYATDCEINQYVENLPNGHITRATIARLTQKPLNQIPVKAGSLVYYELLLEADPFNNDDNSDQGDGDTQPLDSHELWEKARSQSEISLKDQVKTIVNQAKQDAEYVTGRGFESSSLHELVKRLNEPPKVPWQRLVSRQIGRQVYGKKDSIHRLNRRLPYQLTKKGRVNDHIMPIVIAMDVSGSISSKDLAFMHNEIYHLSKKHRIPIEVIQFDMEIQKKYIVKGVNDIEYEADGRGGTSFQIVFDHLKEENYGKETILFIFTDGFGESAIETHGYNKYHWILTEGGELSVHNNKNLVIKYQN